MGINACLDPGMLSSSCGQCISSWLNNGAWATSELCCPRHYWETLEWGKFHISMAVGIFPI